jgi:hypothetical protein
MSHPGAHAADAVVPRLACDQRVLLERRAARPVTLVACRSEFVSVT